MKKIFIFIFIILIINSMYALKIKNVKFGKIEYKKYEKVEATFQLDKEYNNPYDPDEIRVDAVIKKGDKKTVFPCFFFMPVEFSARNAQEFPNQAAWKFRYAFLEEGEYEIFFRAKDKDSKEKSSLIKIKIKGAKGKGYIRIHPEDKQAFQFDDDSPYYPVGFNCSWNKGTLWDYYKKFLNNMAENNVTWFRYWIIGFARQELEWSTQLWSPWNNNYGLGKYNQKSSALLDSIITMAEEKGIYIQVVFETHGEWSTKVNPNWDHNP